MRCKKVICLFKMWRRSLQWGSCCKPCFNSGCSVWSFQLCLMRLQLVHLVRYSFTMFDFYEKMCSFHAESCARLPLNITTEEILPMLAATFESTWSQNGQIFKNCRNMYTSIIHLPGVISEKINMPFSRWVTCMAATE